MVLFFMERPFVVWQSLMFWAAAPVLWLLITLLVFLMYFCYRCCQRDSEKKQNVSCLKWTMAVLTLVCWWAVWSFSPRGFKTVSLACYGFGIQISKFRKCFMPNGLCAKFMAISAFTFVKYSCLYVNICVCVCVCLFVYVCLCLEVCICVCVCVWDAFAKC